MSLRETLGCVDPFCLCVNHILCLCGLLDTRHQHPHKTPHPTSAGGTAWGWLAQFICNEEAGEEHGNVQDEGRVSGATGSRPAKNTERCPACTLVLQPASALDRLLCSVFCEQQCPAAKVRQALRSVPQYHGTRSPSFSFRQAEGERFALLPQPAILE